MLKVAMLAAAVVAVASTAMATNIDLDLGAAAAGDTPCNPVLSLDLACSLRIVDANGDGTISAAELVSFAAPVPTVIDWTPLRPPHGTALDFRDSAVEPAATLSATLPETLERDGSQRLIPALLALGALVILLRRRPT